ncbi:hypothetical protein [Weissella confusa]|uniref:hypothetical protein n=1 Tax=Weissella confusa TaxID=1583 RepID=UPI0011607667|nr:hypothetical protein [Weissella confusa]
MQLKKNQRDWSEESYLLFVLSQLPLPAIQRLAIYSFGVTDEGITDLAISTTGALESYGLLRRNVKLNVNMQPDRAVEQSFVLTKLGSAFNELTHFNDNKHNTEED